MFRFTIRDLVLITLLVAMGLGWWIDHRRLVGSLESSHRWALAEALSDILQQEGFTVDMHTNAVLVVTPSGGQYAYRIPPAANAK